MLFGKKSPDISGRYLSFIIQSVDKTFSDNADDVLNKALKELDIELLCLCRVEGNTVKVAYSTYPYLKNSSGNNETLLKYSKTQGSSSTSDIKSIFKGILDESTMEDLEYSRRISNLMVISSNNYLLVSGDRNPINGTKEEVLKTLLNIFSTYLDKVLANSQKNETLKKENRIIKALQSFTNFAITKTNFQEIADFAVNQISIDLEYPAVVITLRKNGKWYPMALTSSPLTKKAQEVLGIEYNKFEVKNPEGLPSYKEIMNQNVFKTSELKDVMSPPIPTLVANTIQNLLQIRLIYSFPIVDKGNLLGSITYMIREKEITRLEEDVLKNYASQLGIVLSNVNNLENLESSKDSLEKAYQNIEQVDKQKDNLISMASHELRTPVTVAKNAISLINEYHLVNDPNVNDKLEMIKESIERELSIVSSMLEVSRLNNKKLELVYIKTDIEKLIQTAYEELKIEVERKGLKIEYIKQNSPLPEINIDNIRIREVIDNLLTNAIKYTDTGSITITSSINGDCIQVSVADTGKGISKEEQAGLFQMFHRIDGEQHQGGLGLGLYIVKNIIEAHKGQIKVESEVNKGSTFTFLLPITNNI